MLGLPPVALSGGGRSSCRRNFRRQAMAASVPRAAQRLQRAQDQFFLWSISRAPCGSSWRPLRSSRSLMRGEYFARSDARCLHGPALNFLSSFTSLTLTDHRSARTFDQGPFECAWVARGRGWGAWPVPMSLCGRACLWCVGGWRDPSFWRALGALRTRARGACGCGAHLGGGQCG